MITKTEKIRREKISKKLTGIKRPPFSTKHREKLSKANIGKTHSKKTKAKMAKLMMGNKRALGYRHTQEWKDEARKRTPPNKGEKVPSITGNKNINWKGDKAGYDALHAWVARRLGKPMVCQNCGKTKQNPKSIHWANKSGEYKRKLSDWLRLCASCHRNYDVSNNLLNKWQR